MKRRLLSFKTYSYAQATTTPTSLAVPAGFPMPVATPYSTSSISPFGEPFVNLHTAGYLERFTFTGKEKDEETGFSYFGARYYDSDLSGLFLSVDPMADKYPSLSPYAHCAWNPLKLIDPDGEEIYYKEGGETYMYKLGKDGNYAFVNCKTDEVYSGDNQQFVDNLSNALGKLKEGGVRNSLVSFFEGKEDHTVIIDKGKENTQRGTNITWRDDKKSMIPVEFSLIEPSETFVSLGHELAHVRDGYRLNNKFDNMSEEVKEISAMLTENYIRREHGIKQRTYHGLSDGGKSIDYSSYKAIVLPPINGINKRVLNF